MENKKITITEKNEAIAKMIGWKLVKGKYFWLWKKPDETEIATFRPLLFDTDCNWQDEAISYIEGLGHMFFVVGRDISIKENHTISSKSLYNGMAGLPKRFASRKAAIFEALYQFSLYLKKKEEINSLNITRNGH